MSDFAPRRPRLAALFRLYVLGTAFFWCVFSERSEAGPLNRLRDLVLGPGDVPDTVHIPRPDPTPEPETGLPPAIDLPEEVVLGGDLVTRIEPQAALADGARWSVGESGGYASGEAATELRPGRHTVHFHDLPGWREPSAVEALVIGGREVVVSATFTPIPVYPVLSVPEHHVRHGETLEFFVSTSDAEASASFFVSADPLPLGEFLFDSASGHLRYTPDVDDRLPFQVRFQTRGRTVVSQTTITPLPELVAEHSTLKSAAKRPDEESRDHMVITESENVARDFNDAHKPTRSIAISGKVLVFDVGHPANLYPAYNGREDIEQLSLYADRVVIRQPLVLPQTYVLIHARELRFENEGRIITTPKARELVPAAVELDDGRTRGRDGEPGHHGGDVDVFVEQFYAAPAGGRRFILRGGVGGAAGAGRDGRDNVIGFPVCGSSSEGQVLYSQHTLLDGTVRELCGSKFTPFGEAAVAAGVPGRGGDGGLLRSTLDLAEFVDATPGTPGAQGGAYQGGVLTRRFVYAYFRTFKVKNSLVDRVYYESVPSVPGEDAPPPLGETGNSGIFEFVDDTSIWLHPFALRQIVLFAKESYLEGDVASARALLAEYRELYLGLAPDLPDAVELSDTEFNELVHFEQLRLEMETLLHRADSDVDYFGNPRGWVPMLSFESNLIAFENELDASIPVLYLAYWLTRATENVQETLDAAVETRERLEQEQDQMTTAFNEAQLALPGLRQRAREIAERVGRMQAEIEGRERELLERAEENVEDRHKKPIWQKGLGVLAVASSFVPHPVAKGVGAGLGLLSQIDFKDPVASATSLAPKAFEVFSQKDITVCLSRADDAKSAGKTKDKKKKKDRIKRLTECGKFLGAELKELAGLFKSVKVDKKEIEAELEKIRASDSVFNDLVTQIKQLLIDKELFTQELATATQTVSTLSSAIAENVLATHAVEEAIDETYGVLDHNAILHVKEMEQRAKDRLLSYQYFLARAFEYRRLEPYAGSLRLDRLFERFQDLIEAGHSHSLSAEDFEALKALYIDELREIVFGMFDNFNAPERSLPISFRLSNEELETLNESGRVTIDLEARGLFGANEENIRIANLRTAAVDVRPVGGDFGATALLRINYEHSGTSRIASGGDTYLFRHYRADDVNPIVWNTAYDGLTGRATNSELSPAAQSLLSLLLDLEPTADSGLLVFSRPGAFAEILITREVATDNGVDMVVDDLRVELEYHFYNTSAALSKLAVASSDGLAPRIAVSHADANGRRDGQGAFQRSFGKGDAVTLTAPERYGRFVFDGWVINGVLQSGEGGGAATSSELTIAMDRDVRVEALFGLETPDDVPPAASTFRRGDTNGDGRVDLSDGVAILNFLFLGSTQLNCLDAADANDSGGVNIADSSVLFNFLFLGGNPPPAPGATSCGEDLTSDTLHCEQSFCN